MIEVELPDGRVLEIDAPDAQSAAAAAQKFLSAQQQAPQTAPAPQQPDQRWGWQKTLDNAGLQTMKDFSTGVMRGNIPFADEITAAAMTPFGMAKRAFTGEDANKGILQRASDAYSGALSFNRGTFKEAQDRSPVAHTLGQVAGGINTAGALAKGGITLLNPANPTMGNMAARGAGEGALYSGIYGFGEGEGVADRLNKGRWGAATGALIGGLAGAVTGKFAQRAAEKTVPTSAQKAAESQALYKFADDAGLVLKPDRYAQVVDDMFTNIASKGFDHQMHPDAARAIARLQELKGQPLTLQTLETMRQVIGSAAQSNKPQERMIAKVMQNQLDDYVRGITQADVIVQNPAVKSEDAVKALFQARDNWATKTKSERIARLIGRAEIRAGQYSQSGMDNALRTEFRQLAMNDAKMRTFTPAEQDAIRQVAMGTATENALRLVGKLAPRGPVSFLANASTGVASPIMPFVTAAAGELGKRSAAAMTQRNANLVGLLIRSGGKIPQGQITQAQKLIIDALISGQRPLTMPQQAPAK